MEKKSAEHILWILVGILVAIRAFQWGGGIPPNADLDPGWELVLEYGAAHHWQFGTDLIFTYGAWGFLQGAHGLGEMDLARRLFAVTFAPIAALSVVGLLRPLPRFVSIPALILIFLFGFYDHYVMLTLVYTGVVAARSPSKRLSLEAVLLLIFAGLLTHIKFTNILTMSATLAIVTILRLRRGDGIFAFLPLALFSGAFIVFWLLAGQNVLLLPAFVSSRWQITSGYTEAMSIRPKALTLYCALVALLCFNGVLVLRIIAGGWKSFASITTLITPLLCFLYWKHGFVRADEGHILMLTLGLPPLFALVWLPQEELRGDFPPRRYAIIFAILWFVGTITSLLSWRLSQNNSVKTVAINALRSIPDTITRLPQLFQSFEERHAALTQKSLPAEIDLPKTRQLVGQEPIDVFYYRQGIALANQLNYRSRPVMQSYSAYTSSLAVQNADYVLRANLPYILFRHDTLDERHPMLDDAPSVALLLHNYRPALEEKGYLVLQRVRPTIVEPKWETVERRTINWNTMLSLEKWNTDPLWLRVRLKQSLPGKVRHQLYQLPQVRIKVYLEDGTSREYRFLPALGEQGLLINPLLSNQGDILRFWTGDFSARRIKSLEFLTQEVGKLWYQSSIEVEVARCPDFGKVPDQEAWSKRIEVLYPFPLGFVPRKIESPYPANEIMFANKPAFMLHPPGTMDATIPAGSHHLTGFVGIVEGAYTGTVKTDGVTFRIDARGKDGKLHPLWDRTLRPGTVVTDRGEQAFDVPIDPARDTEIRFSTETGASTTNDWAAWGHVRFGP